MNRYIFAFAALLAVAAAKNTYQKCPSVTSKFPFDEAKFAGDWTVIAYIPKEGEGEKKCAKATVTALKNDNGTTMNHKFNFFKDGKAQTMESISYCKADGKGAYAVFKKSGETKFSAIFKKYIVATDYTTYALSIACRTTFKEETKEFGRELYANIFARSKTMSESTLKTLKSILTSYDIEYDSIKTMVHDC